MLSITPINLKLANEFVERFHRHHGRVQGCKFNLGLQDQKKRLRGVLIAGRPVSRNLDDGTTLEVTRCATDGIENGCSFLYQRASSIARVMGYTRLITYTLEHETGPSLRAAGWRFIGFRGGGSWDRPGRARDQSKNTQKKRLWVDRYTEF